MTSVSSPFQSTDPPPGPGLIDGLDALAAALRELRTWAGSPSYARIARDVGAIRAERGVPPREATPGRVTVYDCFRDGRQRIDTDLVVDITQALGAEHEDRTLWRLAARGAMRPAGRVAPQVASLPSRPTPFAGRDRERARLTAADAPRLQVLHGLPGVGKSALAVVAAHDLLEAGQVDSAIRVTLRSDGGDIDPFDAIVSVLRTFAPNDSLPTTPAAQRAAYLRLLDAQRVLLVLDDAVSVEDVELLMPTDRRTRVLITSRWVLDWPLGIERIELGGLDPASSARLLTLTAGRPIEIDAAVADDLWRVSGGLPLAVSLIGARAARRAMWTGAEHVQAYRDQLESLQLEDAVVGALTVTYDGLAEDERRALRLLALHPAPETGLAAAEALIGDADQSCRALLDTLTRSHLLRHVSEDRWEMHALVQVFGRRVAVYDERVSVREAARERLLDLYCEYGAAAVVATQPSAAADITWLAGGPADWSAAEAVRWFAEERATLLATADWADQHGHHVHFLRLSTLLTWHLWSRGEMDRALSIQRVAVSTAAMIGDRFAEATAERCLGMTYVRGSSPARARAHLERSVTLLGSDDRSQLPLALNALAVCSLMTGDYLRAVDELEQVVNLAVGRGDADLRCRALSNLGVAHSRLGNFDQAIVALEEAVRTAAANHWPDRERLALTNLSDIFATSDDPSRSQRAVQVAQTAVELAEASGDEVGALYSETNLAIALHRRGESARGRSMSVAVMERANRLGVPELVASVLNNIADMYAREGDRVEARSGFLRAQEFAERIDAAYEQERAIRGLAELGASDGVTVVPTTRGSSERPG